MPRRLARARSSGAPGGAEGGDADNHRCERGNGGRGEERHEVVGVGMDEQAYGGRRAKTGERELPEADLPRPTSEDDKGDAEHCVDRHERKQCQCRPGQSQGHQYQRRGDGHQESRGDAGSSDRLFVGFLGTVQDGAERARKRKTSRNKHHQVEASQEGLADSLPHCYTCRSLRTVRYHDADESPSL